MKEIDGATRAFDLIMELMNETLFLIEYKNIRLLLLE